MAQNLKNLKEYPPTQTCFFLFPQVSFGHRPSVNTRGRPQTMKAPTDHEGTTQLGLFVVGSRVPDLIRGAKTLQPGGPDSTCSSGPTDTFLPGASVS